MDPVFTAAVFCIRADQHRRLVSDAYRDLLYSASGFAPTAKKLLKKAYKPIKIIFWLLFCTGAAYLVVMITVTAVGSYVPVSSNPDAVIVMGGGIEATGPN